VEEGDLLVALDDRPYQLTLAEAEARRSNAEVDTRVRLLGTDAGTDRRALTAHRSGLTEAEQAVLRAELDLASTHVLAPFAAAVSRVTTALGANVQATEPLVTLVDVGTVRVPAEVLERDFGRVRPGAPATVDFVAFPGERFAGEVRAVSPECDPATGTGLAYIDIPNPEGRIRPGMYAQVVIEAARVPERLSVPRAAILERERRLLVFKAVNGRAEWQYVETGLESANRVEITQGLAPGDTVLVDGHLTLAHGAPISVRVKSR
jgi:RND family efflux transporter MFP subunit